MNQTIISYCRSVVRVEFISFIAEINQIFAHNSIMARTRRRTDRVFFRNREKRRNMKKGRLLGYGSGKNLNKTNFIYIASNHPLI